VQHLFLEEQTLGLREADYLLPEQLLVKED
jgi:hypothetical protein